jgi:hypothetical protein
MNEMMRKSNKKAQVVTPINGNSGLCANRSKANRETKGLGLINNPALLLVFHPNLCIFRQQIKNPMPNDDLAMGRCCMV